MTCLPQYEDGQVRLRERVIKNVKNSIGLLRKANDPVAILGYGGGNCGIYWRELWDMVKGIVGYNGGN